MGTLLLWVGLTLLLAVPEVFPSVGIIKLAGAIIMIIGAILLILGR